MAKKILTVEDAPNIRKLIAYNLKRAGYEVFEAEDGKAAVRVLNQLVPDLIILDIRMPEMDGFALLELMRKYPKAAAIPVIMLTALSTAARPAALRCAAAGCTWRCAPSVSRAGLDLTGAGGHREVGDERCPRSRRCGAR
jgi:two-component system chemotaxis response regulator CheY